MLSNFRNYVVLKEIISFNIQTLQITLFLKKNVITFNDQCMGLNTYRGTCNKKLVLEKNQG